MRDYDYVRTYIEYKYNSLALRALLYLPPNLRCKGQYRARYINNSLLRSFHQFGIALIQLFSSNKHNCTWKDRFCDCSWRIKSNNRLLNTNEGTTRIRNMRTKYELSY